jgi:hypothetical protein
LSAKVSRPVRQCAVVKTAVIFNPSRMRCVLMQVARRYGVMLPVNHSAKAREERLGPIGASTLKAIRLGVIGLLKAELKRRNVGYRELAEKLTAIDIPETERNIANKISRGGFTAAFFIQCLSAVGCTTLRLEDV